MHIVREGKATELNVFIRGNVKKKGPLVKRRFLEALSAGEPKVFTRGSGRGELAACIADPNNPLTARVIVNRVWTENFGRPLVSTPSNFGALGAKPDHPQLLDDLAARFMKQGWSLKWLQRELVLSATYRQSSNNSAAEDEDNRWFARMNRRRLSVEAWRDAMIAASGRLAPKIGGRSMDPKDPKENRRTLYSYISRFDLNPLLATFDFPDPNAHSARRVETTTPLQKMFVLNNPFMAAQARAIAERLLRDVDGKGEAADSKRLKLVYLLLFSREPEKDEMQLVKSYLQAGSNHLARWQQVTHVLLASNEMLYID